MIKSRWDEVHGKGGLVEALLHNASVMIEMRLYHQYGDYLAENLKRTRCNAFNDMLWKLDSKDWACVADALQREEAAMQEYSESQTRLVFGQGGPVISKPAMPWHDDVKIAANRLRMDTEDLKWEIVTYAKRNRLSHNGIGQLLDNCQWDRLAERISSDLGVLGMVFPGRGSEQIAMRRAVKRFEKEWFDSVVRLESGCIVSQPNERARKKLSRLLNRVQGAAAV